jgi:3-phenylpropionate/trans-cinnamate dioxygenase ferredoxin reductase subunit
VNVDVAILGNGVAGYACAARLARHGVPSLLIGPGLPVDRPPLTKSALADGTLRLLADRARLVELGIEHLGGTVVSADLSSRALRVERAAGTVEVVAHTVVLATGLSYEPPPVPGLEHGHVNATPAGIVPLTSLLGAGPRRVAVVGAGLIGVESAATLAGAGHDVTLLDVLERPLQRLHDPLPAIAAVTLADLGVSFLGGAQLREVVSGPGRVTVAHEGGAFDADVVIAATGGRFRPPPGLAADGPVAVASDMAVAGYERVHAVGDLVLFPHERFGPMRFPQWDAAIGTGEQAADSIAGVAGPYDRLPYWWSDIGPRRLAEVGWAESVSEWRDEGGIHVGRDAGGAAVCALVVDEPRRLREARALVLSAG